MVILRYSTSKINKMTENLIPTTGTSRYPAYKALLLNLSDGVAFLTFNNPPLNILDAELIAALSHFSKLVKDDEAVRVIVFQSADAEFFLAHGDINFVTNPSSFLNLSDPEGDTRLNPMQQLHERLRALPQLTIAKLSGYARGGGNELAMALDMRFAKAGKTWLGQPETLMGIIPGGGGTQYLTKLVGRARALEIILGGELLDSHLAERYGVINREIPENELDSFVDTLARRVASLPPGVLAAAKAAIHAAAPAPDALALENEMLGKVFSAPAATERLLAAVKAGAQTREGELRLEDILNGFKSPETNR